MMRETMTNRVKRIISGSANAIVDAIEGMAPEVVMEEAIREVESATDDVRAELGKVIAAKHLANKRLMEENARHEELRSKVAFAVGEKRDDLAQAAIAQQLDIEAQIPILEASISESSESERELEGFVSALTAKKRQMQKDLADFRKAREEAAIESGHLESSGSTGESVHSRVSKAESAFDRLMGAHAGVPASTGTPDPATAARLAELEDLSREHRIQERLAQAKAHVEERT